MPANSTSANWDALLTQKAALDAYNFGNTAGQLKDVLKQYVKTSGIDTELSTTIETLRAELNTKMSEYNTLITHMEEYVESIRRNRDMGGKIDTITNMRKEIDDLKERKRTLYEDKHTSDARKEAVVHADKRVSYHQLFGGISRPIHTISIPILMTVIALLAIIGLFFIYQILGVGMIPVVLPSRLQFTNIIKNPQGM